MKKGLFFLFAIIFLFSGCKKEMTVNNYFSAKVFISSGDFSAKGDFCRNSDGDISLKITSPENLKGYTYKVKDSSVKMTFQGLNCTYDISKFNHKAPIKIMKNILDEFDNSKSLLQDKGEFYQMKIDDYVLKVNNNGFVDSISNSNIHITFVNGKAIPQKVSNS